MRTLGPRTLPILRIRQTDKPLDRSQSTTTTNETQ